MSKSKSSRQGRSATTFWMNKDLKELAQLRAGSINVTLTELINHAMNFYLREGHKLDVDRSIDGDEARSMGEKLAMAELAQDLDIRETGKFEMQLAEISQVQKGLQARVSELEKNLEEIRSGEHLQQNIRAHISAKVDPLIERLGELLITFNPNVE